MNDPFDFDLRDACGWQKWICQLPVPLKELAQQAGMLFLEEEDSVLLVFPHAAHESTDVKDLENLVEELKSFYDQRRAQWLNTVSGELVGSDVPKSVIMPRVVFEIASPSTACH